MEPGDDRVDLPLLVALEKIAQITRLPAGAPIEQQDAPLLGERADAGGDCELLPGSPSPGRSETATFSSIGTPATCTPARWPFTRSCTAWSIGKIERHRAQAGPLGGELLLPEHALAVLDRDGEWHPRRHIVLQRDLAAHVIRGEDRLGRLHLQHREIVRARGAAEAHRVDRQLPPAEHLRRLDRRVAFIVLAIAEKHHRGVLLGAAVVPHARPRSGSRDRWSPRPAC